jgi:hypothetical protein
VITRGLVAALLLQGPAETGQPEEPPASESEPNADQADERVLIRVVPIDEQVTARLKAELGLLGFTAVRLEVSEQTPALGSDRLDQLDDGNASAAIEIVRGEHRIDLWVADGNTGKALNRRLDLTLDPAQAEPRTVARMILRQGGLVTLLGIVTGLIAAFAGSQLIQSLLFGVSPRDPIVFTVTTVTLLVVALLACWVPARRAARLSPLQALRTE